ncbi:MAG: hypothetical protein ABSG25_08765 [Bryobacteraceae bacterium]
MNIIEKEIETIKSDIPRISKLNTEYIFSLVCYKYYYNKGLYNRLACTHELKKDVASYHLKLEYLKEL